MTDFDQSLTYATTGENTAVGVKIADNEVIQALDLAMYQSQGVEHKRIAGEKETQDALQVAQQSREYHKALRKSNSNSEVRTADAEAAFIKERQEAVVVVPVYKKNEYRRRSTDTRMIIARIDTANDTVVEASGGLGSCLISCGVSSALLFGTCYDVCFALCAGTGELAA